MARMMWMAVAALAACDGDDSSRPVELCVSRYSVAQYREGGGPWIAAMPDARGAHTLDVGNDFEFVGVFEDQSYVYVTQWRSTVREWNAEHVGERLACSPAMPSYVTVMGTVTQDALVSLDGETRTASGGYFSFGVEPGSYDLVASTALTGTGGKVLVQRDLAVTAATTLPTLDFSQGVDLLARPIQISNASQVPYVRTYLLVDGASSFAEIGGRSDGMADVLPAQALASDDEQWLYVYAPSAGAELEYTGSIPAIDLLPPLTGVTIDALNPAPSARWSSLPADYAHVSMSIQGENSSGQLAFQELYASRGWNEANAATSLALATGIPGYKPTWDVSPGTASQLSTRVYMPERDGVTLWTEAGP